MMSVAAGVRRMDSIIVRRRYMQFADNRIQSVYRGQIFKDNRRTDEDETK